MAEPSENGAQLRRAINNRVLLVGFAIALAMVSSVVAIFLYFSDQKERAVQNWQIRLGIVADSRLAAVNEWLESNFSVVRELSENASLQLYMSNARSPSINLQERSAQVQYLRNLLVATAERSGFKAPNAVGEVAANVERAGVAGIALVLADGTLVAATPNMPTITLEAIRSGILEAAKGKAIFLDHFLGPNTYSSVGFLYPVYGIQDGGTSPMGVVVGIRLPGKDLYDRLKQPGATELSGETYLVKRQEDQVQFISPLADGTEPYKRSLALSTPDLLEAAAVQQVFGFRIGADYAANQALMVSRSILGTPWVLIRKIDRNEALAAEESRLRGFLIVAVLFIFLVSAGMLAVWRHGTSVRAAEAAERFRISAQRFENMSKFMRVVTNSVPSAIAAVDGTGTYTFANQVAARELDMAPEDLLGKKLIQTLGPIKARYFEDINRDVLERFANYERDGVPESVKLASAGHIREFVTESGVIEVLRSFHVPLRGDRDYPPAVLMIIEDIGPLVAERKKYEDFQNQLINAIVAAVDERDRHFVGQSSIIAEVASAISKEMGLSETATSDVRLAGSLMNLARIHVPTEVLGKEGNLAEAEMQQMREVSMRSARILDMVPFERRILDAIRESGEVYDERAQPGPDDAGGFLEPRILAVANAFVALVSDRPHRKAISALEAIGVILRETEAKFDPRPVAALMNLIHNRELTHALARQTALIRSTRF